MQQGKKFLQARWFTTVAILLVVVSGLGAYLLTHRNNDEVSDAGRSKNRLARDFSLPDASGNNHRLSELRGNVVLLHFWASWCPPCLGEIPQWVEIANEFPGKPLKLVAVSLDESWSAAQKVLPSDKLPASILSLLDAKTQVSDQYGSYAFPETYLINAQGEVVTKWVGPQDWKSPDFRQVMEMQFKQVNPTSGEGS